MTFQESVQDSPSASRTAVVTPQDVLQAQWDRLKESTPHVRARDAAFALGVSECELVALGLGSHCELLNMPPQDFAKAMARMGRVMCLTRNDAIVHERKGVFEQVECFGSMGQVLGPDIDLRLFFTHWEHIFAQNVKTGSGHQKSFQVFDKHGTAIHKIFLDSAQGNGDGFDQLVLTYRSGKRFDDLKIQRKPHAKEPPVPWTGDVRALLQDWSTLKDTHDFFGMLKRHGIAREEAFRAAEGTFTENLPLTALESLLKKASEAELDIMVFVPNPGSIQIHTGPVKNIQWHGPWLNVLDPDFNLHILHNRIVHLWKVEKPSADGSVTSVEAFDEKGECLMMIFGRRKPGQKECPKWKALAESLAQDLG